MEDVVGVLLPLFFVVTGLSVNLSTLNGSAFVLLPTALCDRHPRQNRAGSGVLEPDLPGLDVTSRPRSGS